LDATRLREDFLARHHELFGYATAESCVIESVRVQARQPSTTIVDRATTAIRKLRATSRQCSFDGVHDVATAIVDRASMKEAVVGPAIIEDAWSTVVIPPDWQARPDTIGHLFLTKVTP
jgi:N-methylhydantoinase A